MSKIKDEAAVRGHVFKCDTEAPWWGHDASLKETELMLSLAGMLPASEVEYFLSKPWKWSKERQILRALANVFERAGLTFAQGIELTGAEVARAAAERGRE